MIQASRWPIFVLDLFQPPKLCDDCTPRRFFFEFFDINIPESVILPDRWEEAKASFQDYEETKKIDGTRYCKIFDCCLLAKLNGFDWVWIDTCCIDKKNSAELSDAINSM